MLYGVAGGVLGFLALPPFGALAGLFVGVLAGELRRHKEAPEALRAAAGALLGTVTGIAINVVLALAFIFLFFVFAFS